MFGVYCFWAIWQVYTAKSDRLNQKDMDVSAVHIERAMRTQAADASTRCQTT